VEVLFVYVLVLELGGAQFIDEKIVTWFDLTLGEPRVVNESFILKAK